MAVLSLMTACGQRVVSLWPQPDNLYLQQQSAVPPAIPVLDTIGLSQLNLFQSPQTSGPAAFRVGAISEASSQLRNAPISTLNARLTGLLSGPHGMAVIQYANNQSTYTLGDTLAGEVKLIRIFNDRIVISRRGQYEALLLD
jgi:hypothetical protein